MYRHRFEEAEQADQSSAAPGIDAYQTIQRLAAGGQLATVPVAGRVVLVAVDVQGRACSLAIAPSEVAGLIDTLGAQACIAEEQALSDDIAQVEAERARLAMLPREPRNLDELQGGEDIPIPAVLRA